MLVEYFERLKNEYNPNYNDFFEFFDELYKINDSNHCYETYK